ncbi:MAG TPA: flagellar basal body rod protein FlgC [Phycisphaerae bacterium]|nr:flagellar basal body rod protein FlgC [Phycisphaerae bacterium]
MFGAFDISTSALSAQRVRLDTIASNIANVDSVIGPDGKPAPYRRIFPIFQAQRTADGGAGVSVKSIEQDQSPFQKRYEPGSPAADQSGWVSYPNVDLSTEYVNALETTRAYEANITAVETTKSMMNSTLHLLA